MSLETKQIITIAAFAVGLVALGVVGGTWASKFNSSSVNPTPVVAISSPPAVVIPPTPTKIITQTSTEQSAPERVTVVTETTEPLEVAEMPTRPERPVARIINVKPHYIIKTIPVRVCHDEPQTFYTSPENRLPGAGAIIGGVAGGIAGNQIGRGTGNIAATIGGSIVGAVVGNQIENNEMRPRPQTVLVTVCKNRYVEKKVQRGYEVTYVYNGVKGMTVLRNPPTGSTIALKLTPA